MPSPRLERYAQRAALIGQRHVVPKPPAKPRFLTREARRALWIMVALSATAIALGVAPLWWPW